MDTTPPIDLKVRRVPIVTTAVSGDDALEVEHVEPLPEQLLRRVEVGCVERVVCGSCLAAEDACVVVAAENGRADDFAPTAVVVDAAEANVVLGAVACVGGARAARGGADTQWPRWCLPQPWPFERGRLLECGGHGASSRASATSAGHTEQRSAAESWTTSASQCRA